MAKRTHRTRPQLSHGLAYTPEYRAWQTARNRCLDTTSPAWSSYGGRGITMHEGWIHNPAAFIAHIGKRPSPRHELDRKDNDRGYEPGNVRWVLRPKQSRNRRNNRLITFRGKTKTLSDWCAEFEKPIDTISWRLDNGWSTKRALLTPVRKKAPNGTAAARRAFIKANPRGHRPYGGWLPRTKHFVEPKATTRKIPSKELS